MSGKLFDGGLMQPQDPFFGISHKNIASELTKKNWKKKAIVRGDSYIWITEGTMDGEVLYSVNDRAKIYDIYYSTLDEALQYIGGIPNFGSTFPSEEIRPVKFLSHSFSTKGVWP